jgi:cyclopropane fatty-acyl-phospholipid synthase-like methyltransferase
MMRDGDREENGKADYWEQIYLSGDAGWDLGGPSPVLALAVGLGLFEGCDRLFVPGCGSGHDALYLASQGHQVVACDFAPSAVASLAQAADQKGISLEICRQDLFAFEKEAVGSFDGWFEYTCFCALQPEYRTRYRDLATHLIRPGGRLLFFAFPLETRKESPPFGIELEMLRTLFQKGWRWVFDSTSKAVPSERGGRERLILLERLEGDA